MAFLKYVQRLIPGLPFNMATQTQVTKTAGGNYDTPVGVGGTINNNTGQLISSPQVSTTHDAAALNSHMSGNTPSISFPNAPVAPTQSVSNNTSVTSPIPSADEIINAGNSQTPAEKTNKSLLDKVAALIGQKKGQTQLTNEAETAAGVPTLQKAVNDLNTQLEGLNNQATDLQNQASQGGAIQNQEQQNALGRGITTAGLAPQTAGDLRKNQIQQSAIASQALTVKSAIYGAQGNLSLAKDAADKAANAQYEEEQNQLDYQQALINANLPQMNKEEKNQAALVQAKLADRQSMIDNAKEDKKTIIALAVQAMTNNPGNSAVQYAAQQALAESNKPQPDLQTALGLVGKYQQDPNDVALKVQQLIKLRNDNSATTSSQVLSPYTKTSYDGSQYVDLSTLTPSEKAKYAQLATAQGIPIVLTAMDADKIGHIAVTKSNLNDIMNSFNAIPVNVDNPFTQGLANSVKSFFGDADIRAYKNYRTSAINALQALAGGTGSGLRINQSEINAAVNDIPIVEGAYADTPASAQKKIDNLNGQIDKWQTQILGGGNTGTNDANTQVVNGVTYVKHADGLYYPK